ncbi:2-amino-4-hydroxy-6-hydroxymethyldihydropteridine diphosphokinase [Arcanobacterium hippocoleae]
MHEVTLRLSGVRADGCHGVLDIEHTQAQPFIADIEYTVAIPDTADLQLPADTGKALESDTGAADGFAAADTFISSSSFVDSGNAVEKENADPVAETDVITNTISYADVADLVTARIAGAHANLIETLAIDIADAVLALGARKVTVQVHKPQAPIPHEFTDVSASVSAESELLQEKPRNYVLSLGSNLEDSVKHLQDACMEIHACCEEIIGVSSIYRTAPVLAPGQEEQNDYCNAVMKVSSRLSPLKLLSLLDEIQIAHGRKRKVRWGARTLDIDIIMSDFVSRDPQLILPHPRAFQRRFVLAPWAEIQPDAVLDGVPIRELLTKVSDQRIERTKQQLIPGGMANLDNWIEEYYFGKLDSDGNSGR